MEVFSRKFCIFGQNLSDKKIYDSRKYRGEVTNAPLHCHDAIGQCEL